MKSLHDIDLGQNTRTRSLSRSHRPLHGRRLPSKDGIYGDVAQQIGRDQVSVVSILSNPAQDPHLFETAPSVVREILSAQGRWWQGDRLQRSARLLRGAGIGTYGTKAFAGDEPLANPHADIGAVIAIYRPDLLRFVRHAPRGATCEPRSEA
jgi:hypothetical protein